MAARRIGALDAAGPDLLYRERAFALTPAAHGPTTIHLFPFGGLQTMADWARDMQTRSFRP